MKACPSILAGIALLALSGCGGNSTATSPQQGGQTTTTQNQWTWVAGSNMANQPGVYGTQGTPAADNTPGGRQGAVSWTDQSGNFWLFGGIAAASPTTDNYINDLWKYGSGQWTWVGGSNSYNQAGIYGTEDTSAPGNIPGARFSAVSWKDASGNFWLFGGLGLDSTGSSEFLNDLWEYSAGQWTWIGGSNVGIQNQPGIYGTEGVAAPGNLPGERSYAMSWTDPSGNFWLFGGTGWDSTGALGNLNDLWKYSSGEWTWMGGANVVGQPGTYGVQGTAAAGNTPGARWGASTWTDASGNLWLFGGSSGTNSYIPLNDLWKYSAGQWTWMGGSNIPAQNGVYGTLGVAAANNAPGARILSSTWVDAAGNLWLFGGGGHDSEGNVDQLNDVWRFSSGQWTWAGGSNIAGQQGTYGTLGTAALANIPGGRSEAVGWVDASGNFWLFGGMGYDATGTLGQLNDLWKYGP
jgi:N-acetylneuraminic acid mutarotase